MLPNQINQIASAEMEKRHPESVENKSEQTGKVEQTGKPEIFQKLDGNYRAKLAGANATIEVMPLKDFGFVDRQKVRIEDFDKTAVGEVKGKIDADKPNDAVSQVEVQVAEDKIDGNAVKMLIEAFREIGADNMFVARKSVDGADNSKTAGLDSARLGRAQNFDSAPIFVIPKNKAGEAKRILESSLVTSFGSGLEGQQFNQNPRWQYLSSEMGFNIKIHNQEFLFLFAETEGEEKGPVEENGGKEYKYALPEQDQKLFETCVKVYVEMNFNRKQTKEKIIEKILKEDIQVTENFYREMHGSTWIPSKKEIEGAKAEKKQGINDSYALAA